MLIRAQIGSLSRAACNDKLPKGRCVDVRENTCRPCHRTIDACKIYNAVRHNDVADALARQREGLAVGVADNRVVIVERNARNGQTIVDNLTIGLVRDDKNRVSIRLLLCTQEFRKPPNGLLAVDCTARIVRRVYDNGFRVQRDCRLKCGKVNLKIVSLCGHDDKPPSTRLDKDTILGEERRNRDKFISRFRQCLECDCHGCRRPRRKKKIFPCDFQTKSFFDVGRKDLTDLRFSGRNRIAVYLCRVTVRQDVHCRFLNECRRRHVRIPEAEVKDVLCADLCRTLLPVLKDRTDRGFLCTEFVHLL